MLGSTDEVVSAPPASNCQSVMNPGCQSVCYSLCCPPSQVMTSAMLRAESRTTCTGPSLRQQCVCPAGRARDRLVPGLHDAGAPLGSQLQSPVPLSCWSHAQAPSMSVLFWQHSQAAQFPACVPLFLFLRCRIRDGDPRCTCCCCLLRCVVAAPARAARLTGCAVHDARRKFPLSVERSQSLLSDHYACATATTFSLQRSSPVMHHARAAAILRA